MAMRSR